MSQSSPLSGPEVFNPAGLKNLEEVGSQLVLALEHSYKLIRQKHPDVPEAVIVISSSTGHYGHFAWARWTIDKDHQLPEIMISAEGLKRSARDVLGTLIHEAAHGVAHTRGIQDVSNRGRFHNKKFRDIAEELGLNVLEPVKHLGHSLTKLPEGEHQDLLDALSPRLVAYREFDVVTPKPPRNDKELSIRCSCTPRRKIRVYQGIYEQGPIFCGICGGEFE